jgi:ATP-dependent RNA helicase RhlE
MTYTQKRRSKKSARSFSTKRTGNQKRRMQKGSSKKQSIHPSKFVKEANVSAVDKYKPQYTFDCFDVVPLLKKNLNNKGFKAPLPIQDQAIPKGLLGSDIIGIANTGTGKTIAFAVPVIDRLMKNAHSRVLIMAPTRELAQQILEEMKDLIKGSRLRHALLIGGSSMHVQLKDLAQNPQIIIGTPGRIQDHIKRKKIDLQKFDVAVLDEVDRMLDMGFVNDVRKILEKINQKRQSFFFSATMDNNVRNLISEFSHNPAMISVKTGNTSDHVHQNIVRYTSKEQKIEMLHKVLVENTKNKFIIFDETKRSVDRLNKDLVKRGFKSDAIHGNKSQRQREKALARFKTSQTNVLVATDVAARGIDVKDITHVINYSTPQKYDDYIHRIGRAGRAGRVGYALTFVTS